MKHFGSLWEEGYSACARIPTPPHPTICRVLDTPINWSGPRARGRELGFFFFFFFFFFFSVPSTVPTSEALLSRRSSRHPPPPAWDWLHVPASPTTPRAHSASRPRPQRSTGSDVRSLVSCHPKETLHCCWVTSVVFSSACFDSTYAGHHLLCPLLTTMLAKSRSQTEWASPQRADRRYVPPPILLCGLSDVEGFDQNCPRQGRREEHRDWGHHESVAWRATESETFFLSFF